MHKNLGFLGLLSLVLIFAVWFTAKAGGSLYHYVILKEEVPIEIEKWEVIEIKKDTFTLFATFTYTYKEKIYKGYNRITSSFPNGWAAEKAKLKKSLKGTFWLNPHHPEKGSLEKKFPFKSFISALILIGLSLYFFILGVYVRHQDERK